MELLRLAQSKMITLQSSSPSVVSVDPDDCFAFVGLIVAGCRRFLQSFIPSMFQIFGESWAVISVLNTNTRRRQPFLVNLCEGKKKFTRFVHDTIAYRVSITSAISYT